MKDRTDTRNKKTILTLSEVTLNPRISKLETRGVDETGQKQSSALADAVRRPTAQAREAMGD